MDKDLLDEELEKVEGLTSDLPIDSLPATVTVDGYDIEIKTDGTVTFAEEPTISNGPTVTVGGQEVTLTKENVKNYLGKVVTNFKDNYEGQEETIQINGKDYKVSKKYRLYYVDFDNKYGDGEGTIYLKAECTSNIYNLQLDETSAETKNSEGKDQVKIKQLNPGLYKDEDGNEKTPPDNTYGNMQAVTWLLNENNWSSLKGSLKTGGISQNDINYIVGSPSVEMMMDSYNTKYADVLKGTDKPDFTEILEGERRKLFYKYEIGNYGYRVGPCADDDQEYGDYTSNNSVWTDSEIDTMYYPGEEDDGNGNKYWLASPSSRYSNSVCFVRCDFGSQVFRSPYGIGYAYAFCPLVSLKSTVKVDL